MPVLVLTKIDEAITEATDDLNNVLNHPPMIEGVKVSFMLIAMPLLEFTPDGDSPHPGMQAYVPGPVLEYGNLPADAANDPTGFKIKILEQALDRAVRAREEAQEQETRQ